MDNLTHTLFAVTLGRTPLARAGRGTTAALIIASNAPDIDSVALAGGMASYLKWHRGPTHGPLGVVVLALLSACAVWVGRRIYDARWRTPSAAAGDESTHDASFGMLVAVSGIGILLHVLMDFPNSYGIRLLSPFDWHWFGLDLLPIVDLYVLAALLAGIVFGQQSPAARRRNATIVLTLMAANYGLRAVAHHEAIALAPKLFGPTLPQPCDPSSSKRLPIDVWPGRPVTPPATGQRCLVEVAAVPTFSSPFSWQVILAMSNAYEIRDIDLLDARWRGSDDDDESTPWRTSVRYPNVWTPTVAQAASTWLGQLFLGFSRFPAARSAIDSHGVITVRWTDVRFAAGFVAVPQPRPGRDLFTATVRMSPDGTILEQRLGR